MEKEFKNLELYQKWEEHYKMIFDRSRSHTSDAGDNNKQLNRYIDVKPYDQTRVRLTRTKGTDYINANLVSVPKAARQYILTQGPLPETLAHFWLMVWEQKSNVIVMLNRILEMEDFVKCEQYWPNFVGDTINYDDVKLSVTLKSSLEDKHYTIREIKLEDQDTQTSRIITQFHYTAWPDHGQPDSPTSFLRLLTAVRKSGGLDKMDEPTIVHCSAGIGRSGTFCLIDSILSMIESQGSTEGIDIVSTLVEMRDHRMGLIQSPVQLRFAYMSIIYGVKILENANKLHPSISPTKDSLSLDNSSSQQPRRINGSANDADGKKSRRNKRRQHSSNSLNTFKKNVLVEALDDVDSDSAERLFYDTMKPHIKKPRNSSPVNFNNGTTRQASTIATLDGSIGFLPDVAGSEISAATKAQMLTNAINSLLTEPISTNNASCTNSPSSLNEKALPTTDSVLLRRRERELRNQRLAEKTMDMENRMKLEKLKQVQFAQRMRSTVFGGVAALVLSYIAYSYLHGNN